MQVSIDLSLIRKKSFLLDDLSLKSVSQHDKIEKEMVDLLDFRLDYSELRLANERMIKCEQIELNRTLDDERKRMICFYPRQTIS